MKAALLAGLACWFLAGAAPLKAGNPFTELSEHAVSLAEILKADNDFSRMSAAEGGAKAYTSFLADDALELFADKESPSLKPDVLDRMRRFDAKGLVLTWTPFKADVAASNDFGYSFGQWELRQKEGGKLVGYGYYSTVWRKVQGKWKAIFDMGNESPLEAK